MVELHHPAEYSCNPFGAFNEIELNRFQPSVNRVKLMVHERVIIRYMSQLRIIDYGFLILLFLAGFSFEGKNGSREGDDSREETEESEEWEGR